jgi:type IV pilus assembly protein PilB
MHTLLFQLVQKGLLSKEKADQLQKEIEKSGERVEEAILRRGLVAEDALFAIKSEILGMELRRIVSEEVSLDVLSLIPEESATFYKMVPFEKKDQEVSVGMLYPEDLEAQEALKFLARRGGFDYKVFLVVPSEFNELVKRYRTFKGEVTKALGELEEELKKEKEGKRRPTEVAALERLVEEAPITRVVAVLLRHAVEGAASDIHIEPTRKEIRVRLRQDGVLHTRLVLPLKILPAVVARIKILSNMRIDETRVPQDGRFTTRIDEKDIDFRVSTFPTALGEKVALRILDPSTGLKGLAELGLSKNNFKLVEGAIKQPFGLILATGPTGSGKTTTLYSLLQILNKEGVNVMTLEDPIEYFIDGVNQSQVRPEIGYDFASGLRSMLRQDPNVMMVGEIRDSETAGLAIHAALTGHIVLSTLHTNNATGVIPRLVDLGVAPYLIPPTLRLAIAQRLVRKLCEFCKKETKIPEEKKELFLKELEQLPEEFRKDGIDKIKIFQPVGCRKCRSTGYSGRVAIFEILALSEEMANSIVKNLSETEIEKIAKKQGMMTMRQDGILKVLEGITSLEEVIRVTEQEQGE